MILFFDIETVPDMLKTGEFLEKYPDEEISKMGLYAEFAKVVCISCGFEISDGVGIEFKLKSFVGEEKDILEKFFDVIKSSSISMLAGYNIISFDMPFLVKRGIINNLCIPKILSSFDIKSMIQKKPWDIKALDIMNIWKGTSQSGCSLDLLCKTLGIKSPKDIMDGEDVQKLYEEKKFVYIQAYCEGDVKATRKVWKQIENYI